jgi:hypothetical protein
MAALSFYKGLRAIGLPLAKNGACQLLTTFSVVVFAAADAPPSGVLKLGLECEKESLQIFHDFPVSDRDLLESIHSTLPFIQISLFCLGRLYYQEPIT